MPDEPTRSPAYERYLERLVAPTTSLDRAPRAGAGRDVGAQLSAKPASIEAGLSTCLTRFTLTPSWDLRNPRPQPPWPRWWRRTT